MGVLMPTPNTEVSAHGYAMDIPLRPIEGTPNFRYPHGPRDGPVTNYYTRSLLVDAGEYDPLPPPEEVRLQERARISSQYTREQQAKNAATVKRKLAPMAKTMAKKRARR